MLKTSAVVSCLFFTVAGAIASELPSAKSTTPASTPKTAAPSSAPPHATAQPSHSKSSAGSKGSGAASSKELISNGSFEVPIQSSGWSNFEAPSNGIYGWQVSGGNVDLFHHPGSPDGTQCLDLEGQEAGTIRQALRTVPGVKYELTFCAGCHPMGGGPAKQFFVRAADQAKSWAMDCTGYDGKRDLGWRKFDWQFTAHEPVTVLEIGSMRKHGTGGPMIDVVSVMKAGARAKAAAAQGGTDTGAAGAHTTPGAAGGAPEALGKNLIVNGSFEQSADPGDGWLHYDAGSTAIYGWRVVLGNIDLYGGIVTPFGKKTIDLQGQQAGAVAQTIPTEPGATYKIKFWVGSYDSRDKKIYARAAGKKQIWPIAVSGSTERPYLAEVSFNFKAREDKTSIEIGSYTDGTQGPVLDNVSCVKIADPVKVEPPAGGPVQTAAPVAPPTDPDDEDDEEEEAAPTPPAATPPAAGAPAN